MATTLTLSTELRRTQGLMWPRAVIAATGLPVLQHDRAERIRARAISEIEAAINLTLDVACEHEDESGGDSERLDVSNYIAHYQAALNKLAPAFDTFADAGWWIAAERRGDISLEAMKKIYTAYRRQNAAIQTV